MPSSDPTRHLLLGLFLLGLLLAGCGDPGEAPRLGDWTLETDALTLNRDLQVSETDTYFLGAVQDLAVTSEGRMIVLDSEFRHLKVLRPDGTLLDTLGRQGRGPGEFRRPTTLDIARGDSIYVFDTLQNRLTVFPPPPSPERARSVVLTREGGNPTHVRVLGDRLVARFTPGYTRAEGLREPSPNPWRLVRERGVPEDSLLTERRRKVATSFEGPGAAIDYLPFGRETLVAVGPDARLYNGWTDRLRIHATSLEGSTEVVAAVPADPVPVTETERDAALADVVAELRGPIGEAVPETKPAFTDLVVADDGRLWVRRPPAGPDADTTAWWRLDPAEKTIQTVQVSTDLTLEVVQNGYAYGTTTTAAGAPALVRYRVRDAS